MPRVPLAQQIADVLPVMRRCAEDIRAAFPRNSVRQLAPIDAVLAAADQLAKGGTTNAATGLAPLIASLLNDEPAKKRSVMHAVNALASFASAVDQASRGDPDKTFEEDLEKARDFCAMSFTRAEKIPTVVEMTARIEKWSGDENELREIVRQVVEHRMKKCVPLILERLPMAGMAADAVKSLQQIYRPKVQAFAELCAGHLSSPRAATRRWAVHGMMTGVRVEQVEQLTLLLKDSEPLVRAEAASALRAATVWHPASRATVASAARDALDAHPEDRALAELVRATS
jgi:hypothetical protein